MTNKHRLHDRPNLKIIGKHAAIRRRYEELCEQEKRENPIRARYLAKGYYVEAIAADPFIGLSPGYIQRILNRKPGKP